MADCLFCKMVSREIEPDVVYENDHVLAKRIDWFQNWHKWP